MWLEDKSESERTNLAHLRLVEDFVWAIEADFCKDWIHTAVLEQSLCSFLQVINTGVKVLCRNNDGEQYGCAYRLAQEVWFLFCSLSWPTFVQFDCLPCVEGSFLIKKKSKKPEVLLIGCSKHGYSDDARVPCQQGRLPCHIKFVVWGIGQIFFVFPNGNCVRPALVPFHTGLVFSDFF